MKNIKTAFPVLVVCISVLSITGLYSQGTYTNYCPDSGFNIKVVLSLEYLDNRKETVLTEHFRSVSELFESKELKFYSWAVFFEKVKKRSDCFRIQYKKDFENLLYDRKIKIIQLKYYSGKNYGDEVTLRFDVKNRQSYSHIKNGKN